MSLFLVNMIFASLILVTEAAPASCYGESSNQCPWVYNKGVERCAGQLKGFPFDDDLATLHHFTNPDKQCPKGFGTGADSLCPAESGHLPGTCKGNVCCPGIAASGGKTFPCPTASPDMICQSLDKIIDCTTRPRVEIVFINSKNMTPYTNQVQTEDIWFVRREEAEPHMKEAIGDLVYTQADGKPKTAHDVNIMLTHRTMSVVGMGDMGAGWMFNIGEIDIRQMDPNEQDPKKFTGGFFRPCWNSVAIDNTDCKYVTGDAQDKWVGAWGTHSYEKEGTAFPFTGRGWTFDWQEYQKKNYSDQAAVGLNEFVVLGNKGAVVNWREASLPVDHFCKYCKEDDCGAFDTWKRAGGCSLPRRLPSAQYI